MKNTYSFARWLILRSLTSLNTKHKCWSKTQTITKESSQLYLRTERTKIYKSTTNSFLTQVQESLTKLNNEMDYHRLEDIARYVMSKDPTREEMTSFLNRRQISETIFRRPELQCIVFSPQANRWVYIPENDSANLLTA